MRELNRPGQREIWITRGHLWALASVMFFIGVLSFFVGLLYGRSQASPASGDVASQALVDADLERDALDELLAKLEAASVEDLQDGALSFPGTLPEGEVFPVPQKDEGTEEQETVVLPGRTVPEPPPEDPGDAEVPRSGWAVQVASYTTVEEADAHIQRLEEIDLQGYRAAAVVRGETRYRVRVGAYRRVEAAMKGLEELSAALGLSDAIVVRAD